MDDTLHYLTYDPKAMWTEMYTAYMDAGGDPLFPGDEKEMLLRGTMAILLQTYAAFDHAARMQTLRYAAGEYLDIIGEKRGMYRIQAVKAMGTAEIVAKREIEPYTIAAGTIFTVGSRTYAMTESVLIPAGSGNTAKQTLLECMEAGTVGNALPAGTALNKVEQNAKIVSVTLLTATAGGVDLEENEAYRDRIREGGFFGATTGPKGAYQARAMDVSANIVDAGAYRKAAGVVGVALILEDGLTSGEKAALIANVAQALSDDAIRPLSDTVEVEEAETVPYQMNIAYQVGGSTSEDVLTKLNAAVLEYKTWQENTVGRIFDPFRLVMLLYNAGATMAEWTTGSHVNGEAVARRPIAENERLRGEVNLTLAEG